MPCHRTRGALRHALVGHLEEEQEGELLHVVAVRKTVVAEQIAVIPEFLNDSAGVVRHGRRFVFFAKSDCILLRLDSLDQAPRRISRVRVKAIDRACLC